MTKAHPVRKVIRELLSVTFWVHALCVSNLFRIPSATVSQSATRIAYNVILFSFILYYSYFSRSGWLSVLYDLVYVFIWPFLTIFRLGWAGCKAFYKYIKKRAVLAPVSLITVKPNQPKIIPANGEKQSLPDAIQQIKKATEAQADTFWKKAARPFTQFVFLWSILTITLHYKPIILFACAITLAGAFRAVISLWGFLTNTSSWVQQIKDSFIKQLRSKIGLVLAWEEGSGTDTVANEVNGLRVFEAVFGFIADNRTLLSKCTAFVAALITIPFYLYVSLLFASVYFGIARVQGIHFSLWNAIADSLYIPFAFTDLPHSIYIRLIAGLQAIAVTVMGWNIFFRQLSSKLDRVANAADEMRGIFKEEEYRRKSELVASFVKRKAEVVADRKPPASASMEIKQLPAEAKR